MILVLGICFFFLIYVQLLQVTSTDSRAVSVFVAALTTFGIVLLDVFTSKSINSFVSFEKHFSSVGRNRKRVSYFAIFFVLNIAAVIFAYSFSRPISILARQSVGDLRNTYNLSYDRWFESCSKSDYRSPPDIIAELSKKIDVQETRTTIGYWSHFTSQPIDGFILPAFAYENKESGIRFYQVGCDSKNRLICNNRVANGSRSQYPDSCAFISNLSFVADRPIPKILFSAAVYDPPFNNPSNQSEFRLRSFAEEGSLYGFLFAFIIFKAIRLVFYYVYNDFFSIVSHRLLSPLLIRLGYNPDVRCSALKLLANINQTLERQYH